MNTDLQAVQYPIRERGPVSSYSLKLGDALRRSIRYLAATGLAIACSTSAVFAQSGSVGRAPLVHKNVMPGVQSEVAFTTMANAACTLSPSGADAQSALKLYADDDGNVRFYVKAPADADPAAAQKLLVQMDAVCQANGQTIAHAIQITPAADVQDSSPASSDANRTNQSGRLLKVRRALKGDPMLFRNEELMAQGYPPRPDQDQAPDAYAAWLHAVSKPATYIEPKLVNTGRFHGPANTIPVTPVITPVQIAGYIFLPKTVQKSFTNWSGFAVNDGNKYDMVVGEWVVPNVTGENLITDFSAIWVGLDGDTSADVLQDGTGQDIHTVSILGSKWVLSNFYAWTEWFPLPEQLVSNFAVRPGDRIYANCYIGSGVGVPNLNGATAYFFLENYTTGQYTSLTTPIPSGVSFKGDSAEWIVERPTVGGTLPDLADYNMASITSANMHRSGGTWLSYTDANNEQITMTDLVGTRKLSTVARTGATSMSFTWLNFK